MTIAERMVAQHLAQIVPCRVCGESVLRINFESRLWQVDDPASPHYCDPVLVSTRLVARLRDLQQPAPEPVAPVAAEEPHQESPQEPLAAKQVRKFAGGWQA